MKMNNVKWVEPETGVLKCLRALKADNRVTKDTILYADITVEYLMRSLTAAEGFINHTKFELGEDWGK